jgi:iron complex transport system substrate-binding protein
MTSSLRRLPLATLAALALTISLALAGCGSDAPSGTVTSDASTTAEAEAFPVTLEHAFGETTITDQPERVVVVGYTDVQPVLAFGVKPVGVMPWFGEDTDTTWPWIQDAWGDTEPTYVSTEGGQINYEKVASLRPDLILGLYAKLDKHSYELLSAIAPTVAQNDDYPAYSTPWDVTTRTVGAALGRADQAEEMVTAIEQDFADIRAEHPEFADQTGLVVDANGGDVFVFGPQDPRGVFLGDLGFTTPSAVSDYLGDSFGNDVSPERLDLLEADRLVMLNDGETEADLAANQLFTDLDVVKDGGMISLPYGDAPAYGAAIAYNNVLSIPYALEHVVPLLVDPAAG